MFPGIQLRDNGRIGPFSHERATQPYAEACIKGPRLELLLFSGVAPLNWIRLCESFFEVIGTLLISELIWLTHFTGRADIWFNGLGYTWQQLRWQQLGIMIMDRFSELGVHEVISKFQSLQQTTNVTTYIDKFVECVALLRRDHLYLQESFFLSHFIGGLKNQIKHQVTCHQPRS